MTIEFGKSKDLKNGFFLPKLKLFLIQYFSIFNFLNLSDKFVEILKLNYPNCNIHFQILNFNLPNCYIILKYQNIFYYGVNYYG